MTEASSTTCIAARRSYVDSGFPEARSAVPEARPCRSSLRAFCILLIRLPGHRPCTADPGLSSRIVRGPYAVLLPVSLRVLTRGAGTSPAPRVLREDSIVNSQVLAARTGHRGRPPMCRPSISRSGSARLAGAARTPDRGPSRTRSWTGRPRTMDGPAGKEHRWGERFRASGQVRCARSSILGGG